MEQVRDNPTVNQNLTITSYEITATDVSGLVSGAGIGVLERGMSFLLHLDSGTAQGFTEASEYYVIPVSTNTFRIAATFSDALNSVPILTASGNAGAGDIYPNYKVGGVLYVGTSGNINIRGDGVSDTGSTSFSLHKNVADGSLIPLMIDSISASGTTASDLIIWTN